MEQRIVNGLDEIKSELDDKKIFLVRDCAYDFLDIIKEYFDAIPHVEFSEFTPNPLYEQVLEGVKLFNERKCDLIVAVGGGSTIDVAKCIKLFCKMDNSVNYLEQGMEDTGIELIAIPTTAGTGSESTRHAVIYYEGVKQSIAHSSIVPNHAVLVPSVLRTLPVYQKKCTMLDALCQAIESWWSVNSTDVSKEYSCKAITAIMRYWEEYIFDNTEEAAEQIMKAANYAGRAINITATTAAHAMSYKVTSLYQLPHGHAVAICMQEVWTYMNNHIEDCKDERGIDYLQGTLMQISKLISVDKFIVMLNKLEMNKPIAKDKENDVQILTQSVNPVRLKNNPVFLSIEVLEEMYRRIIL